MYYYEVLVRSERYRKRTPLTYSSAERLKVGAIVQVELQRQLVPAVVLGTGRQIPKQVKQVSYVYDLPPIPPQSLQLLEWMVAYYRSAAGSAVATIVPPSIPKKLPPLLPAESSAPQPLPPLTAEQAAVYGQLDATGSFLLHGRTGSGKTRLYQELTAANLSAGKSVIVLSPEISLTSQLARQFEAFGQEKVVVLHSHMTSAQRLTAWRRVAETTVPLIIIGARSALFTPIRQLGLIVVDEFHEPAYKQDQEPRYHTPRVAAKLAGLHGAAIVYGSATPSVTDYYLAEQMKAPVLRLTQSAISHNVVANTEIVNMRQRENFSRSNLLSTALIKAIEASLDRREQAMLYLNQRGTARVSLCQNCGWQARCPNCDLPLTYHSDKHHLRCHTCGYSDDAPSNCPVCGHTELVFRGIGTKALVREVERLFPQARIMRFDSDNEAEERFEKQYDNVRRGEADIIIGTQTLAKGLDLPLLSTLGVVVADSSLSLPDFTATERTYQLIRQVLGRVQRGHRNSTTIIQTYEPESPLLSWAIEDDWTAFYRSELGERQQFGFPPFRHLLAIRCRRASAASAEKACVKIKAQLREQFPDLEIDGPTPAFHERSSAGYTWQIVVKATARRQLLDVVDALPGTVTSYDLDPLNLL